jgi:hypothetical protein
MQEILYYLSQPKIASLAVVLLLALYVCYRILRHLMRSAAEPKSSVQTAARSKGPVLLNLENAAPREEFQVSSPEAAQPPPFFEPRQKAPSLLSDLFHAALIVLAVVVAAGFTLVVLPQGGFDRMTQNLQARHSGNAPREQLAFLYFGDEVNGTDFHVRGVVRNITDQPLEKLDADIRLYARDGRMLQTAVIRMDKETIAPDETAEFHLVYSNYNSEIGSYSVDFRTREGEVVSYKDMRAARAHP